MKDRRGVEIKVGDTCVHASGGRYGAYDVVRVSGFTPKRVQVDQVDYMRSPRNYDSPSTLVYGVMDPKTLIVVTLPHAENRLNS